MSEEKTMTPLSALMSSSPVQQDAPQDTLPAEEVVDPKNPAEPQEEANPELAKLLEETQRLNKRLQDTQKWANEQNQKALTAQKKLYELGEITEDEFQEFSKTVPNNPDDIKPHLDAFWTRYNIVKDLLADKGENPDELVEAFGNICGKDQAVMKKFVELPDDKKVAFVLDSGREVVELDKALKTYGTFSAALSAIKKQAADDAVAALKLKKDKGKSEDEDEVVKEKPRLPQGGQSVSSQGFVSVPLSTLMNRK